MTGAGTADLLRDCVFVGTEGVRLCCGVAGTGTAVADLLRSLGVKIKIATGGEHMSYVRLIADVPGGGGGDGGGCVLPDAA